MYGLIDEDAPRKREEGASSSFGLVSVTTPAPPLEQRFNSDFFTDDRDAVPLLGQAWDAGCDEKSIARGFDDFGVSIGAFEMVDVSHGLSA